MSAHYGADMAARRRLLPDWEPTLGDLQALEELRPEARDALRRVARDWRPGDSRWDVLLAVLEYTKREHAHELAEKIRADRCGGTSPDDILCPCGAAAADLIDPEVSSNG